MYNLILLKIEEIKIIYQPVCDPLLTCVTAWASCTLYFFWNYSLWARRERERESGRASERERALLINVYALSQLLRLRCWAGAACILVVVVVVAAVSVVAVSLFLFNFKMAAKIKYLFFFRLFFVAAPQDVALVVHRRRHRCWQSGCPRWPSDCNR